MMLPISKIRVVLALVLGMALPVFSPAWAQNVPWKSSDFRMDSPGDGTLRFRGNTQDVDRVTVSLRRNGNVDVTIYTDRGQGRFNGKWDERNVSNGRARLQLDMRGTYPNFSDEVEGTLTLERRVTGLLETWRIRRLELSGIDQGYRMTIRFDGTRNNDGGGDDNDNDGDYDGGSGDFQEHSGEAQGNGRIREGRDDRDLDRANIRLSRGGAADITFTGDGNTTRIAGRWRNVGDDRAEIRIDRFNGRTVTRGEGRIVFRRQSRNNLDLRNLDFEGRTSYGDFSIRFSAERDDNGDDNNNGGSDGIDSSQRGRGTLRTSGDNNTRLSRATVKLDKNGRAQILVEASNGTRYTLSGRWTRSREREFNITITSALSYNNASGHGRILLRNDRDFSSIELSGRFGNRTWSVDFDAD